MLRSCSVATRPRSWTLPSPASVATNSGGPAGAAAVALSFEGTKGFKAEKANEIVVTGNPVRAETVLGLARHAGALQAVGRVAHRGSTGASSGRAWSVGVEFYTVQIDSGFFVSRRAWPLTIGLGGPI